MKKHLQKLALHRETVLHLDATLLSRLAGASESEDCPDVDDTTGDGGGGGSIWTGPFRCPAPTVGGCNSGVVTICPTC